MFWKRKCTVFQPSGFYVLGHNLKKKKSSNLEGPEVIIIYDVSLSLFFFFLLSNCLHIYECIVPKAGYVRNLILQQMLVFLCVSVSDSERVLHQPSLTVSSNMLD